MPVYRCLGTPADHVTGHRSGGNSFTLCDSTKCYSVLCITIKLLIAALWAVPIPKGWTVLPMYRSVRSRVTAPCDIVLMAAVSAILDIQNFKFLQANRVGRANMHHQAKFQQNWSNNSCDVAIYHFFRMADVRHHGCVGRILVPPMKNKSSK